MSDVCVDRFSPYSCNSLDPLQICFNCCFREKAHWFSATGFGPDLATWPPANGMEVTHTSVSPQRGVDHIGINTDWINSHRRLQSKGCFTDAQGWRGVLACWNLLLSAANHNSKPLSCTLGCGWGLSAGVERHIPSLHRWQDDLRCVVFRSTHSEQ